MEKANELAKGIHRVSAKIGSKELFEGIWPIPRGVMLNSYVVKGREKTALIDLVKDWDGSLDSVNRQMEGLGLAVSDIDVIVLNHMEGDHTGALASFLKKNPKVEIYCSDKAVPLVKSFYGVTDNIHAVKDGETLDLGEKTLRFFLTPNIHWPETMMTYAVESGILFSCDAFGAYGQWDHCFYDQLGKEERTTLEYETRRYYANIVASFSAFVTRGIRKLLDASLSISAVAPSHGVVWRGEDALKVIDIYRKLASYMDGPREKEITLLWSSMYGNTQALVETIATAVLSAGVKLNVMRVPQTHVSDVLGAAWSSSALIVGMPTYQYRMFPPMYDVLDEMERHGFRGRKVMRFGSYGWSGGAARQFEEFVSSMKLELVGSVEFQGHPREVDREKAAEMARSLALSVKE